MNTKDLKSRILKAGGKLYKSDDTYNHDALGVPKKYVDGGMPDEGLADGKMTIDGLVRAGAYSEAKKPLSRKEKRQGRRTDRRSKRDTRKDDRYEAKVDRQSDALDTSWKDKPESNFGDDISAANNTVVSMSENDADTQYLMDQNNLMVNDDDEYGDMVGERGAEDAVAEMMSEQEAIEKAEAGIKNSIDMAGTVTFKNDPNWIYKQKGDKWFAAEVGGDGTFGEVRAQGGIDELNRRVGIEAEDKGDAGAESSGLGYNPLERSTKFTSDSISQKGDANAGHIYSNKYKRPDFAYEQTKGLAIGNENRNYDRNAGNGRIHVRENDFVDKSNPVSFAGNDGTTRHSFRPSNNTVRARGYFQDNKERRAKEMALTDRYNNEYVPFIEHKGGTPMSYGDYLKQNM